MVPRKKLHQHGGVGLVLDELRSINTAANRGESSGSGHRLGLATWPHVDPNKPTTAAHAYTRSVYAAATVYSRGTVPHCDIYSSTALYRHRIETQPPLIDLEVQTACGIDEKYNMIDSNPKLHTYLSCAHTHLY